MSRLSDEDVDRIARRTAGKLVGYGLVIIVALWILPFFFVAFLNATADLTRGLPGMAAVAIAAVVAGAIAAAILWLWGRARRAR
ncbi:MAG TPA: hypothetical protein VIA63_06080 [Candidatus Limnocylindria bacterium]|jgi:protein-S-isoprenylcysteine O-methyltransferase Ste14